jgi:hypothetical protein
MTDVSQWQVMQDPMDAVRNAGNLLRTYSDKAHFVYEFLQNANDAGLRNGSEKKVSLSFHLRDSTTLTVMPGVSKRRDGLGISWNSRSGMRIAMSRAGCPRLGSLTFWSAQAKHES